MNNETLWGLLMIAYIVPAPLWYHSRDQIIEARKSLYPGRRTEELEERRLLTIGLLWTAGLVFLIASWRAGWSPVESAITLAGFAAIAASVVWIKLVISLSKLLYLRIWLAGSLVWTCAVGAWYVVFFNSSALSSFEVIALAVLPPVVGLVGVVAFTWAMRQR